MSRVAMNPTWVVWVMLSLGMPSLAWAQGKLTATGSPRPAPANLRERDGQPVQGNPKLRWKYAEIVVEWGFKEGTEELAFDGNIESTHLLGALGTIKPLPEDQVTMVSGERAWLKQGKRISVENAPTHYGTLSDGIVSDVNNAKVTATVDMPSRKMPATVLLRLRHPSKAPIKSVAVNGMPWSDHDNDKEVVKLKGLSGRIAVVASY